jgi:hypothetical protein
VTIPGQFSVTFDRAPSNCDRSSPEQTQQEYATAAFVDTSGAREMEQLVNGNLDGAPSQKLHLKCKKMLERYRIATDPSRL